MQTGSLRTDESWAAPSIRRSKEVRDGRLRKLQFTVDEKTVAQLELSRTLNGDSTLVQSFRRAVSIMSFFDRVKADGHELLLKKGDEVFKIFIP
jgi:hypothetical protein